MIRYRVISRVPLKRPTMSIGQPDEPCRAFLLLYGQLLSSRTAAARILRAARRACPMGFHSLEIVRTEGDAAAGRM